MGTPASPRPKQPLLPRGPLSLTARRLSPGAIDDSLALFDELESVESVDILVEPLVL
jgi:hypothetical protein